MAFCKLLTMLVLIHINGGLNGAEVRSFIVGGEDAPKGKWPWMVHLNISKSDGTTKWRCGGTIVSNQWVLTAASCWDKQLNPDVSRSMVWVGAHSLRKGGIRYMGITYVIPHPNYQAVGSAFVNDIALVKLKKKLTFSKDVRPVGLASVDDTFGSSSECWITGWGDTATGVPLDDPEILQQLKIPIVPESVCKSTYPELTSDMLCAGSMVGGKDACKGDYGGPLVCRKTRDFMQVGIMSYGSPNGCAISGYPGVFTRVSKHLRFINDYIHQA
ncbi:tryptase-2-like [Echeneis naucrates]|uniref:Tryptase-2-like n=1 Tax=Echeneis naucrates TaxID=173247 RepID=A0A665U2I3_ECHNA|nr:tryptase-2-like [Echeneis naucrates]